MGLTFSSVVEAPIDEVFAWYERPGAFARLCPPWQPLSLVAEAASLRDGRAVLRMPGGLRWVAQHSDYDPPHRFVDELTSLPLPWRHVHEFEAVSPTTTRVIDHVDTPVPNRALQSTFRYRHRQLADDLAVHRAFSTMRSTPMTIAITGSSGLVGTALAALLSTGGHNVIRLVRGEPQHAAERHWDMVDPQGSMLDGVDAVVHLAGASIAGRFSAAHKRAIYDSRIGPTEALAKLIADSPQVATFVVASGVGYYGADCGDEELTEGSARGAGFLADVVEAWEKACEPAVVSGTRVVNMRTGIAQSPRGGSLRLLRPLFLAGLGGRLGDGKQWTSWIDLDDLTDIYYRALVDSELAGPVNAVAPIPVRNAEYTKTLAHVLHRPALLPVPAFGPRVVLGADGVAEIIKASQRVSATRLAERAHRFRRPDLTSCLRHQLGKA